MITKITDPRITAELPHKYLGIFGMVWISILLSINFTAIKTFDFFGVYLSAAIVAYPITYIFSDIFTEVYGYKISRRIIWSGLFCILLCSLFVNLLTYFPAPESFTDGEAFNKIFKSAPIVSLLVILSFWIGELVNSFLLAKIKFFTKGEYESLRYILSTFFGQIADASTFFIGTYIFLDWYTWNQVVGLIIAGVLFCTSWEIIASPITHKFINWIKEKEGIDTYDVGTNFNPFKLG